MDISSFNFFTCSLNLSLASYLLSIYRRFLESFLLCSSIFFSWDSIKYSSSVYFLPKSLFFFRNNLTSSSIVSFSSLAWYICLFRSRIFLLALSSSYYSWRYASEISFFLILSCCSSTKSFNFLFSISCFSRKNSTCFFSSLLACSKFFHSMSFYSPNRSYFLSFSTYPSFSCNFFSSSSNFLSSSSSLSWRFLFFLSCSSNLASSFETC